jgi:small subunit ribosomal protein S6
MADTSPRPYELMVLITPEMAEDAVAPFLERVGGWISDRGGEIEKLNPWGKRRLAYPIKRHRDAYYAVYNFKARPDAIAGLENSLRISEDVLRHLVVKLGD